jgi:transposase
MALLSVIRRLHVREHLSIRTIARRTGRPRNTIRKYLRSEAAEPVLRIPDRPSKLDLFAERLAAWLRTDVRRPCKQKRTTRQFHAELVELGYDGLYRRVAAFVRAWRDDWLRQQQASGRGIFVPLARVPGLCL